MAIINVDDVHILNETGAQVDKVTGLFTKNENATTDEKQMARLNIAAGGSNDNLLDNAYFVGGGSQLGDGIFPINQQEQTSYTSAGQTIDRWTLFGGSVSVEADGVVVTATPDWGQGIPVEWLPVGTYTASVKMASGEIGSITFTTTGSQYFAGGPMGNTGVTLNFIDKWTPAKSLFSLQCQNKKIAAAKLEAGTVSTLANDITPPPYQRELAACQLFFERIKAGSANHTITVGMGSASVIYASLKVAPKYATPTISATAIYCGQATATIIATGLSIYDADNHTGQYSIQVDGQFTAGAPYRVILPATAYINLSVPF